MKNSLCRQSARSFLRGAFWALLVLIPQEGQSQAINVSRLQPEQFRPINLTPVVESKPALKHRLFPDDNEMFSRNGAIYYHRAITSYMMTDARLRRINLQKPNTHPNGVPNGDQLSSEQWAAWMSGPLDEMPLDDVKTWVASHEVSFQELRRACYSRECDWGMPPEEELDDFYRLRIPELQRTRSLARLLVAKARIEIAEKRFEDAIETIKVGFKLGHDVGKSKFVVGSLVGIACVGIIDDTLLLLIQQPDCPSLYWALASLPTPLVNSRLAIKYELALFRNGTGSELLKDPKQSRSVQAWKESLYEFFDEIDALEFLNYRTEAPRGDPVWINAKNQLVSSFHVMRGYVYARQALLERGFSQEQVDGMPSVQACAILQKLWVNELYDEYMKQIGLPYPELLFRLEQLESEIWKDDVGSSLIGPETVPYTDVYLPALRQIVRAEVSIHRRLARTCVLEAIRLHAAAEGKLPESLDEIKVVPVPDNPNSGKPFEYGKTDGGFRLNDFGELQSIAKVFELRLVPKQESQK